MKQLVKVEKGIWCRVTVLVFIIMFKSILLSYMIVRWILVEKPVEKAKTHRRHGAGRCPMSMVGGEVSLMNTVSEKNKVPPACMATRK